MRVIIRIALRNMLNGMRLISWIRVKGCNSLLV